MGSRFRNLLIIYGALTASCASEPSINVKDEIIATQVADNNSRCIAEKTILMSCEQESWGKNKIILLVSGKTAALNEITKKEPSRKLELDSKFPSVEYAIGNRKRDVLASQLEKSGFCAFNEIIPSKIHDAKSDVKRQNKNIVAFLPASILTGLMENGTIFIRKWSSKKPAKTKGGDHTSAGQSGNLNLPEDTIAKCAVESRGVTPVPSEEHAN